MPATADILPIDTAPASKAQRPARKTAEAEDKAAFPDAMRQVEVDTRRPATDQDTATQTSPATDPAKPASVETSKTRGEDYSPAASDAAATEVIDRAPDSILLQPDANPAPEATNAPQVANLAVLAISNPIILSTASSALAPVINGSGATLIPAAVVQPQIQQPAAGISAASALPSSLLPTSLVPASLVPSTTVAAASSQQQQPPQLTQQALASNAQQAQANGAQQAQANGAQQAQANGAHLTLASSAQPTLTGQAVRPQTQSTNPGTGQSSPTALNGAPGLAAVQGANLAELTTPETTRIDLAAKQAANATTGGTIKGMATGSPTTGSPTLSGNSSRQATAATFSSGSQQSDTATPITLSPRGAQHMTPLQAATDFQLPQSQPASEPTAQPQAITPSQTNATTSVTATQNAAFAQQMAQSAAQPPAQQLGISIARGAKEGLDRIDLQLHPQELGRVDVRMELGHDGRIIAVVSAERSDTLEQLRRDIDQLERALSDAGFDTDSNSFRFEEGDREAANQAESDSAVQSGDDEATDIHPAAAARTLHFDGIRVDISV
jgi:flagellar hook-length control protein FliK